MSESVNLNLSLTQAQFKFLVEAAQTFDELQGIVEDLKRIPIREGIDVSPPRAAAYLRHRRRDVFIHPQGDWV